MTNDTSRDLLPDMSTLTDAHARVKELEDQLSAARHARNQAVRDFIDNNPEMYITWVAHHLGVSRYTIYTWLREITAQEQN